MLFNQTSVLFASIILSMPLFERGCEFENENEIEVDVDVDIDD